MDSMTSVTTHFRPHRLWHTFMGKYMEQVAATFSKVHVTGLENIPAEGGAVLVCNHLSYFDAVALTAALEGSKRDVMVLAKAELFRHRVLGSVLRRVGVIPVERGTIHASEALREAVNSLKHGELVALFPEGTIPRDGQLLSFKTGAVRMALEAGVPIIPMAMVGTDHVIASNLKRVKRTLWRRYVDQASIRLAIGEPLILEGDGSNRDEVFLLTEVIHDAVESMVEELNHPTPKAAKHSAERAHLVTKKSLALGALFTVPVLGFALERLWRGRRG